VASRIDASVRISSMKSSSSLRASSFISTEMTASVPYASRNGVAPVVECGVVRLRKMTLLAASAWPLV
ncbi:hypothetical protein A2U01_0050748, partial [Trifolium medium]|nr:hypothetical protein [Trifolium medium]